MTLNDILMNNLGSAYAESKGLIKKEKVNKFKAFYESNKASKKLDLMVRGESFKSTINEVINYTRGFGEAEALAAPAKKGNVLEGIKNAVIAICQKILKFLAEFFNIGYEAKINNMLKACDKLNTSLEKVDADVVIKVPKVYAEENARNTLNDTLRAARDSYNAILDYYGEEKVVAGAKLSDDFSLDKVISEINEIFTSIKEGTALTDVTRDKLPLVLGSIKIFGKEMLELVKVCKIAKEKTSRVLKDVKKSKDVNHRVLKDSNDLFSQINFSRIIINGVHKFSIDILTKITKEITKGTKNIEKHNKKMEKSAEKAQKTANTLDKVVSKFKK